MPPLDRPASVFVVAVNGSRMVVEACSIADLNAILPRFILHPEYNVILDCYLSNVCGHGPSDAENLQVSG